LRTIRHRTSCMLRPLPYQASECTHVPPPLSSSHASSG
jgi:hypothetical protein